MAPKTRRSTGAALIESPHPILPAYIPSRARSSSQFPDYHILQPGTPCTGYCFFAMNGTNSITSPLAALALAHGFVPGHGEAHSASLRRVIHVDFGRLSLLLSVEAKEKPNSARASRVEGLWGSISEQIAYSVLALAAISSGVLFFVQSAVH